MNTVAALRALRDKVLLQDDLNFLLTNRVPRVALTHAMGWFSRIRSPLLARASIAVWRAFTDLDLSDAREQRFDSLQACFTRELRPGARPIDYDPGVLVSPCDAIVGACGSVAGNEVFQAKGFPYRLSDLLGNADLAARYRSGCYATLRLKSSMYHRFHAPVGGRVREVNYISGDTWNVNPIALERVERLYCKNERAVIALHADGARAGDAPLLLVPVAAVLVASIRLHFIDVRLHLRYRGPNRIVSDARLHRGEEMGWFEHGSTIIVVAPQGHALCEGIASGTRLRMGQRLMHRPQRSDGASRSRRRIG